MFIIAFVALLFVSSTVGVCTTNSDAIAESAYQLCQLTAITGNSPAATKAQGVCNCLNTLVAALTPNCDANTIVVDGYCAAATVLAGVGLTGAYDFSTCNACSSPPASPLLPSACSTCIMKLVSCATTGYYNLQTYPAASLQTLSTTCNCVGSFYSCFSGCGSPNSQFINQYCQDYSFCSCDGSINTVVAANLVAYLKSVGFTTFQSYFRTQSGAVSIDCVSKTTSAGGSLDSDRFICDINFGTGTVNYTKVHLWVAGYIGKSVQIAAGEFPTGPLVGTLKRDNQETEVTSATTTYTFQVTNDGARMAAISGALIVVLALFFAF